MHRRPLTLADVYELVQQDGIFTVQINVFLYKSWLFVNIRIVFFISKPEIKSLNYHFARKSCSIVLELSCTLAGI